MLPPTDQLAEEIRVDLDKMAVEREVEWTIDELECVKNVEKALCYANVTYADGEKESVKIDVTPSDDGSYIWEAN